MDIPQERKLVTEVPGPKSLALFERRAAAIPPGVANIHPIVTARASGQRSTGRQRSSGTQTANVTATWQAPYTENSAQPYDTSSHRIRSSA